MKLWKFIANQFSNKAPGRTLLVVQIFQKPKDKAQLWSQIRLGVLYFGFILLLAWSRHPGS